MRIIRRIILVMVLLGVANSVNSSHTPIATSADVAARRYRGG
mgnify:CR=1 FL=1